MVEVPTANDAKNAGSTGLKNGVVGGLGQTLGRAILGPGLGTAAGGIGGAAMLDGNDRDIVATLAVVNGINELGMMGGGSANSQEQVM